MCVISLSNKARPSEEMVEKMYNANDHGAGIAWREGDGKDRKVKWEKGLDLEEIQKLIAKVPMPFVAHFRIASCGGQVPALTHPFPISRDVQLALSGTTKGYVLFHNGHWGNYKSEAMKAAQSFGQKVPTDKWSDSRTMAWMAHLYGLGILEFIDEKCIAFGPDDLEIVGKLGHSDWSQVNDVWVSNRHWEHVTHRRGKVNIDDTNWQGANVMSRCANHTCNKLKVANSMFCHEHQAEKDGKKPDWQCHQQGCVKSSQGGAFCPEHTRTYPISNRPPFECMQEGCKKDVVGGSVSQCYCEDHTTAAKREFKGGAPADPTFRNGDQTVRGETDEQEGVQSSKEGVRGSNESGEEVCLEEGRPDPALISLGLGVGENGKLKVLIPEIIDPAEAEQFRWACSLNPSPYKPHQKVKGFMTPSEALNERRREVGLIHRRDVDDHRDLSPEKGITRMICSFLLLAWLGAWYF